MHKIVNNFNENQSSYKIILLVRILNGSHWVPMCNSWELKYSALNTKWTEKLEDLLVDITAFQSKRFILLQQDTAVTKTKMEEHFNLSGNDSCSSYNGVLPLAEEDPWTLATSYMMYKVGESKRLYFGSPLKR